MNGKREKSPLANKMKEIRAILIKHNGKKIKKIKRNHTEVISALEERLRGILRCLTLYVLKMAG